MAPRMRPLPLPTPSARRALPLTCGLLAGCTLAPTTVPSAAFAAPEGHPTVMSAGVLPATQPENLPEQLVDEAGVLEDRSAVEDELQSLRSEHGMQLFVVYVDEFTDSSGQAMEGDRWTEETFSASGLGTHDALLAVAVDQRRYGMYGGEGTVSGQEGTRIESEYVEPALAEDDWAGAATGAVRGFHDAADGKLAPGGRDMPGMGLAPWLLTLPLLIGGAVMVARMGRPGRGRATAATSTGGAPSSAGASPEQLERRVAELLVQVDDAVRSSDEEVRYSRAQFGTQATQEFTEAVRTARGKASEAFALKRRVDDALRSGAPEESQRADLEQITVLAGEALATLDAQSEKFERLRDLQARAPQVLQETAHRADEVEARLPGAREQLRALQVSYEPRALATVAGNIEQAERLVASARQSASNGQQALQSADQRTAVTAARTGEDALGQASDLLDQVDDARVTLENSQQELATAIGSISQDISDAHRLRPGDAALAPLVQRAEQAVAHAEASRRGGDPLAALSELAAAEDAIDAALEPARSADEHRQKVAGSVAQRLTRVRAAHASVDEFIRTRRGSMGSRARTEISEAGRLLDAAEAQLSTDPQGAAQLLDQAERLVESARAEAENDLGQGPFGGPGGFGGGYGPRGGHGGIDVGSLVLGGILSGGFGGGGIGGSSGGGFGGGGRF
ncbi:TPM domain-containing protein [Kytococcus sp. Marseille-QA3725]